MSTRSIIGVYDDYENGKWHGVYHHWDGYPTGVGATLMHLLKTRGGEFIRQEVIEKHPEGWSTINGNWDLEPVNVRDYTIDDRMGWYADDDKRPPEHFDPSEKADFITHETPPGQSGVEYLYLLRGPDSEGWSIDVFACQYFTGQFSGQRMIGAFGMGVPDIGHGDEVQWKRIGTIYSFASFDREDLEKMGWAYQKIWRIIHLLHGWEKMGWAYPKIWRIIHLLHGWKVWVERRGEDGDPVGGPVEGGRR